MYKMIKIKGKESFAYNFFQKFALNEHSTKLIYNLTLKITYQEMLIQYQDLQMKDIGKISEDTAVKNLIMQDLMQ